MHFCLRIFTSCLQVSNEHFQYFLGIPAPSWLGACVDGVCLEGLARQCLLSRAIVCCLGAELAAQDAFCFPHHLEAGLLVSSGIGGIHAFHVLLLRGHKPFAVGRSIDPIRLACRSCNYSSAWRRDRQVCKGGATPKSLAEGPLRENR